MGKRVENANFYSSNTFEFEIDFNNQEELIHNSIDLINKITKDIEFKTFEIGAAWPINDEIDIKFKYTVRDSIIDELVSKFDKLHDIDGGEAYFLINFSKKVILLRLNPVFVYGKYCKFSRELAQTEHFCGKCMGRGCSRCNNTGHILENSVEQILDKNMVEEFNAKQIILHGAGREDGDVLMLGTGRPMVLEVVCPTKREIDLEKLEEKINNNEKLISINSLKYVEPKIVIEVKNSVHDKKYKAKVICEEEVDLELLNKNLNKKISVDQQTPVRVSKRRVDKIRKKEITLLKIEKINEKEFDLELLTSHGTYVKEFISGDEDRTTPSLSSIIKNKCSCKQLDVLEIV